MIKEAMEWLATTRMGEVKEIEKRPYWTRPNHGPEPIVQPECGTLTFSSLTGLVDYINNDPDKGAMIGDGAFVHVKDSSTAQYVSPLVGPWLFRHYIAQATAADPDFRERRLPLAEMILTIRRHFAGTPERDVLIDVLSKIVSDEKTQQFTDDGVSQQVTVKSGVASLMRMDMPGDVSLIPLGGFAEVMQPPVDYILRLQKGREEPMVILAPVLSPTYALEYMESVRTWLIESIHRQVKVML